MPTLLPRRFVTATVSTSGTRIATLQKGRP